MDRIGRGRLNPAGDLAPVGQRDPQARIGRHAHGRKAFRGQKQDFFAEPGCAIGEGSQRPDDAVNLRVPGVCRNQYRHVGTLGLAVDS
jgi:hypothetical protein